MSRCPAPHDPSAPRTSRRRPLTLVLLGGLVVLAAACGGDTEAPGPTPAAAAAPQASIVEVARVAGQFSALLRAVEAAGLTETLHDGGPFTVFAPTDGAFSNLPDGAMESLLEDPETLAGILLHHVVPGVHTLAELRNITELETAGGGTLTVTSTPQGILIGGASILTADVRASNGIVHVLTQVLLP
ncbi:MAG: fasciclin domain-containing protein [Gemmatimonadales bacterium]|nr:MAG: fasciclin domain-containing protein [Gemmatimonadales bacterium]